MTLTTAMRFDDRALTSGSNDFVENVITTKRHNADLQHCCIVWWQLDLSVRLIY